MPCPRFGREWERAAQLRTPPPRRPGSCAPLPPSLSRTPTHPGSRPPVGHGDEHRLHAAAGGPLVWVQGKHELAGAVARAVHALQRQPARQAGVLRQLGLRVGAAGLGSSGMWTASPPPATHRARLPPDAQPHPRHPRLRCTHVRCRTLNARPKASPASSSWSKVQAQRPPAYRARHTRCA